MTPVKMDKRRYHSPIRQEQAQVTRGRVLDAALELFASQGYGATPITAIARAAGVVPETVYAVFGSKRGIIDALVERAAPADLVAKLDAEWVARSADRGSQLDLVASFSVGFWVEHAALAQVFRRGTGDAEIADEWSKRQAYRRAYFANLLATWPDRAFRSGLDRDRAADVLWALATDEVFSLFVRTRGWQVVEYEAWLADALRREILAD
jgi:AcrR family transcriptional regulator